MLFRSALSKLPADYTIFHSFYMSDFRDNQQEDHEIDFVIVNKRFGILCIEAKTSQVYCEGSEWFYGSNVKMKHGGPFRQVSVNMHELVALAKKNNAIGTSTNRIHFCYCVWFVDMSPDVINEEKFPPDASKNLILNREDFLDTKNLKKSIERIFTEGKNFKNDIDDDLYKRIIEDFLCPKQSIVFSKKLVEDQNEYKYIQLLESQKKILDFIDYDESESVAVNGAAGTGKTLIAVELARRVAEKYYDGDSKNKVLFLCVNKELQAYLSDTYKYNGVDFMTLSAYTYSKTGKYDDYNSLLVLLNERYGNIEELDYRYVVVDEGQDFGIYYDVNGAHSDKTRESILKAICDNLIDNEFGSFYIFYDENQLIQSNEIPDVIISADNKWKLKINCRNTDNIAITSVKLKNLEYDSDKRKKVKIKLLKGAISGDISKIHFAQIENKKSEHYLIDEIDSAIKDIKKFTNDIVILTCTTNDKSLLSKAGVIKEEKKDIFIYNSNKYRGIKFTTCRKFKGLEADAIILVDMDKSTFESDINSKIFYVGTSRAKLYLHLITTMSEDDCKQVLKDVWKIENSVDVRKEVAKNLGCVLYKIKNE